MLRLVGLSFDRVPLEFHPRSIPRSGVRGKHPRPEELSATHEPVDIHRCAEPLRPRCAGAPLGPNASIDRHGPGGAMMGGWPME